MWLTRSENIAGISLIGGRSDESARAGRAVVLLFLGASSESSSVMSGSMSTSDESSFFLPLLKKDVIDFWVAGPFAMVDKEGERLQL